MLNIEQRLMKHIDLLVDRYPKLEYCKNEMISAYALMEECYKNGGKLLIAGNGGSAADAQHFAAEILRREGFPRSLG